MLTAAIHPTDLLGEPLESDPNSEIELNQAGFTHAAVCWHRASNTCLIAMDRDNLAALIASAHAADHDPDDHEDCDCDLCPHCGGLVG